MTDLETAAREAMAPPWWEQQQKPAVKRRALRTGLSASFVLWGVLLALGGLAGWILAGLWS